MPEQDERVSGPLAHRPVFNLQRTLAPVMIRQRLAGTARRWRRRKGALAAEGERVSGPLVPPRSHKLLVTVVILALLPPLLVYPLFRLHLLWTDPLVSEAFQQCASYYDCPTAASYAALGGLLVLGPPFLLATASLILGYMGVARARRRPDSRKEIRVLEGSMAAGLLWAMLSFLAFGVWMFLATTPI